MQILNPNYIHGSKCMSWGLPRSRRDLPSPRNLSPLRVFFKKRFVVKMKKYFDFRRGKHWTKAPYQRYFTSSLTNCYGSIWRRFCNARDHFWVHRVILIDFRTDLKVFVRFYQVLSGSGAIWAKLLRGLDQGGLSLEHCGSETERGSGLHGDTQSFWDTQILKLHLP